MSKQSIFNRKQELVELNNSLKTLEEEIAGLEKEKINRENAIAQLKENRPGSLRIGVAEKEFEEFLNELEMKKDSARKSKDHIDGFEKLLETALRNELDKYKPKKEIDNKKVDIESHITETNNKIQIAEKRKETLQNMLESARDFLKLVQKDMAIGKKGATEKFFEHQEKIKNVEEKLKSVEEEIRSLQNSVKSYERDLVNLKKYIVVEDNIGDYSELEDLFYELKEEKENVKVEEKAEEQEVKAEEEKEDPIVPEESKTKEESRKEFMEKVSNGMAILASEKKETEKAKEDEGVHHHLDDVVIDPHIHDKIINSTDKSDEKENLPGKTPEDSAKEVNEEQKTEETPDKKEEAKKPKAYDEIGNLIDEERALAERRRNPLLRLKKSKVGQLVAKLFAGIKGAFGKLKAKFAKKENADVDHKDLSEEKAETTLENENDFDKSIKASQETLAKMDEAMKDLNDSSNSALEQVQKAKEEHDERVK